MLSIIFDKLSRFSPIKKLCFILFGILATTSLVVVLIMAPRVLLAREPIKGGRIKIALNSSVEIPLPYQEQTLADLMISRLVFGQAGFIREGELIPDLAESITIEEGNTIITPHAHISFHNGTPITAEDIMYSLNEAFNKSTISSIPQIEITNTGVIIHSFTNTSPYFREIIEAPWISEELFKQTPPIKRISNLEAILASGSGPYKITSSPTSTHITLRHVRNYPGPYFAYSINLSTHADISNSHTLSRNEVVVQESESLVLPQLPEDTEPLMLPTKKIIGLLIGKKLPTEQITPITSLIRSTELHNKALGTSQFSMIPFDTKIPEASVAPSNPARFELLYPENLYFKTLAERIQQQAQEQSIALTITPVKNYNLKALIEQRNFDALLYGYEINTPTDIQLFFKGTNTYPVGLNIFGINSSEIDTLVSGIVPSQYSSLNEKLLATKAFIPFLSPHTLIFAKKSVRGIVNYDKDRSLDLSQEPRFWYTSEKFIW
ncbi:MAG TPA: ABC transporter substrate-binding protein [Candidatus Paceibacterota bacterium]